MDEVENQIDDRAAYPMKYANLSGANLSGADLSEANFSNEEVAAFLLENY